MIHNQHSKQTLITVQRYLREQFSKKVKGGVFLMRTPPYQNQVYINYRLKLYFCKASLYISSEIGG